MLLRASGETRGEKLDVHVVTDAGAAASSGVRHAAELVAFADALVARDEEALAEARRGLLEAVGPEALVDAAAVASNFERMVRIADATGIPLDPPMKALTEGLRRELGIDRFGSAANTPPSGALARWLGSATASLAGALARGFFRLLRRTRS